MRNMKKFLLNIFCEIGTGFGVTISYDALVKQAITEGLHGLFILFWGVVTTIVIHYLKKYLNRNADKSTHNA